MAFYFGDPYGYTGGGPTSGPSTSGPGVEIYNAGEGALGFGPGGPLDPTDVGGTVIVDGKIQNKPDRSGDAARALGAPPAIYVGAGPYGWSDTSEVFYLDDLGNPADPRDALQGGPREPIPVAQPPMGGPREPIPTARPNPQLEEMRRNLERYAALGFLPDELPPDMFFLPQEVPPPAPRPQYAGSPIPMPEPKPAIGGGSEEDLMAIADSSPLAQSEMAKDSHYGNILGALGMRGVSVPEMLARLNRTYMQPNAATITALNQAMMRRDATDIARHHGAEGQRNLLEALGAGFTGPPASGPIGGPGEHQGGGYYIGGLGTGGAGDAARMAGWDPQLLEWAGIGITGNSNLDAANISDSLRNRFAQGSIFNDQLTSSPAGFVRASNQLATSNPWQGDVSMQGAAVSGSGGGSSFGEYGGPGFTGAPGSGMGGTAYGSYGDPGSTHGPSAF